ncbi:hypothetical protein KCU88_g82, partial [Aureobasidium melanogenum]
MLCQTSLEPTVQCQSIAKVHHIIVGAIFLLHRYGSGINGITDRYEHGQISASHSPGGYVASGIQEALRTRS